MADKEQQIDVLTERNDQLENYFRNTIIPQLYIDGGLIIRKFTPPAMKQFNLSKSDVGKPITEIKENFRYHNIIEDIKLVIEDNEILEKEIQTSDLRWYQMNIIPYVLHNKQTNGVIITFVEITMRINELKAQEKLVSDHELLLDTISHDIKNPLTNLILAVDFFKTASTDNPLEFQALLKMVDNALQKIHTILNELLDSRKQHHKYGADKELINFENILDDVRLTLNDNIKASGSVIKREINVAEISFSRRKLRSLLFNLINNAIKFSSPDRKPEIFIKTMQEGEFFILSVKDNGIGIDAGKQEAIFNRYFRLDNHIEGTGLGLYLVKEIVTLSGGKIIVNSERNIGSEFIVYLKNNGDDGMDYADAKTSIAKT